MPAPSFLLLPSLALTALAISACATVPARGGLADVQRLTAQRLPQHVVWQAGLAEDSLGQAYVARQLHGEMPVDSAIQVALLRNRALQATFEELGLAQADVVQAGLLSNPIFSGESLVQRGGGRGVQLAGIAWPFIDALQRPLRKRVAERDFAAARARVANAVLSLAASVRIAYVDAQSAEQMVEMRATVVQATEASASTAAALLAAGNLSDLAVAQERALAADARLELIHADEASQVARAELERSMGIAADSGWHVSPRLTPPSDSAPVSVAAWEALARVRRLDLRAARYEAEAAARAVGLARRFALLADGTIGAAYEREPDGIFRGGTLSIPIPLFDQGQGRTARARAQLRQAVARHDALAVDIGAEVRTTAARTEAARARVDQLRRVILPLRRRIVDETQKFVNAMEQSLFTLLLARQAEIDAGQSYIGALRDYWMQRAQLERALGGSFAPLSAAERAEADTSASGPSRSHS